MAFETGKPKTGGRKKGVKNKSTLVSEVKEGLGNVLVKIVQDIIENWEELTLFDKVNLLPKIAPFLIAKKSSNVKVNWSALDESEQTEVLEQLKEMLRNDEKE